MIAAKAPPRSMFRHKEHITFFRQSGWMMIASTLMGVMMYFVHKPASHMPKEEYGLFGTLLYVIGQMSIPAMGLQGVFMQQAAASLNPEHEKELAGVFRGVLRGTFFVWLLMAGVVFLLRRQILAGLGIVNPAALWITVLAGLIFLWRPLAMGILQGRQNFLWCGWTAILEGAVRFSGVWLVVGLLGDFAAGALSAVLLAALAVLLVAGWFCRDCFVGEAAPVDWVAWLKRVVPLTLGLGVGTFMLTADMIFVRYFFPKEETGYYVAAGMIGRALVYFTTPLTAVMFPKIVRSAALGQGTSALKLALGLTMLAGAGAAVVCTAFPWLPLRIVYDKSFIDVSAPLVPWFAWCMLPLTLATVLLNNLMAKSRFASVPWLVAVAAGYGAALYFWHDSFKMVIQIIGCFGLLLLAVCAWFSFRKSPPMRRETAHEPGDGTLTQTIKPIPPEVSPGGLSG
jgi:O-antigen/teichoic acid export membrane protein